MRMNGRFHEIDSKIHHECVEIVFYLFWFRCFHHEINLPCTIIICWLSLRNCDQENFEHTFFSSVSLSVGCAASQQQYTNIMSKVFVFDSGVCFSERTQNTHVFVALTVMLLFLSKQQQQQLQLLTEYFKGELCEWSTIFADSATPKCVWLICVLELWKCNNTKYDLNSHANELCEQQTTAFETANKHVFTYQLWNNMPDNALFA